MAGIIDLVGNTPLVEITRLNPNPKVKIYAKLEGNNPGGSVKDRAALNMIRSALERGEINKNTKLIEATSGNTGIALAMIASVYGIEIELVMPSNSTRERTLTMQAFGAKVTLLDFVSSMGTTGTIMGCSRFLKEKNPNIQIIGCQPTEDSSIPGIRRWPEAYLPKIFEPNRVDRIMDISEAEATAMSRKLAQTEGIFAGMSSGGGASAAFRLASELEKGVIVFIACDRGDRYLSSNLFG
jgi:cysteine synthase B